MAYLEKVEASTNATNDDRNKVICDSCILEIFSLDTHTTNVRFAATDTGAFVWNVLAPAKLATTPRIFYNISEW
jgi:hypothetical protein